LQNLLIGGVEMAKDWEFYKALFLECSSYKTRDCIKYIESFNLTPIESIAYIHLHELLTLYGMNNLFILAQEKIGKYTVDFLVKHKPYTLPPDAEPLHKIIVECDGHEWHEKTKQQAQKDKERDRFLVKHGYKVLRYTGSEIVNNPYKIYFDLDELMAPQFYKDVSEKA
jgi:very-short-patch-repair endonuclease